MVQNDQLDDSMDFEVFNLETGDRLGLFTVSLSTYTKYLGQGITHEYVAFKASPREGSVNIDPTSAPYMDLTALGCNHNFGEPSVFTLHN
jgi:hypothetical protein